MPVASNGIDESEAVRLYRDERWTLRRVAEHLGTNHHRIRRVLHRSGVRISPKQRRAPMSAERRQQISERMKGRKVWSEGKTLPESMRRANMRGKLGGGIDVSAERYPDFQRLKVLTWHLAKRKQAIGSDNATRQAFLDRFYSDTAFVAIYAAWVRSGKNRWLFPSLDHKRAKCNGGDCSLDNLCFLTWFENRAKADMSADEWAVFKRSTNTRSDLFVESLCPTPPLAKRISRT